MTQKLFSELGLSAELLKAIDKLGFEQASPIQAESIPALMSGRDVVGQSQTGSGKTAAFAIPAIEKTDAQSRTVQTLILCPTRELAVQVSEEVHKLALFKRGVRALPIYGGQSYERQFHGLQEGAQIVIGTPGRVMDHMRRGTIRFENLRMAILDEVDVMLNMGFREDIEFILQATPATRQTVFFSATIPRPIQELIQKYVRDPQQIRIEQKAMTVPTVEQVYYEVDRRFKIELLTRLIDLHDYKLGIIFCNTKRMVDDLVDHLNAQGYSADRLHGDMGQNMRDRVMNRFRKSGLEFLVATDVAARGIDVDDVQVVVNYDLPYDPEDYVHRIGRTGRAGRSGRAISFVSGRELFQIQHIERFTKMRIQRQKVPTVDEVQEARANLFLGRLRATLQSGEFERQDELVGRLLEEGFTSTDIASALIHHLQNDQPAAPPPAPSSREGAPYERPERPERPGQRGDRYDDRRDRFDDRRGRPDDRERPQRWEQRGPQDRPGAFRRPDRDERSARPERPGRAEYTARPARPASAAPAPAAAKPAAGTSPAPAAESSPEAEPEILSTAAAETMPVASHEPADESPKSFGGSETSTAHDAEPASGHDDSASADDEGSAPEAKPARPAKPAAAKPAKPPFKPTLKSASAKAPFQSAYKTPYAQGAKPGFKSGFKAPYKGAGGEGSDDREARPAKRSAPPFAKAPYTKAPFGKAPFAKPSFEKAPFGKAKADSEDRPKPASRRTPSDQVRLFMNVGTEMGVAAGDVVGAILGETGLPSQTIGTVDLRDRHLFVDVAAPHVNAIVAKLNRATIKGRRVKVKLA